MAGQEVRWGFRLPLVCLWLALVVFGLSVPSWAAGQAVGDFDGDGTVTAAELGQFAALWARAAGGAAWPAVADADGDFEPSSADADAVISAFLAGASGVRPRPYLCGYARATKPGGAVGLVVKNIPDDCIGIDWYVDGHEMLPPDLPPHDEIETSSAQPTSAKAQQADDLGQMMGLGATNVYIAPETPGRRTVSAVLRYADGSSQEVRTYVWVLATGAQVEEAPLITDVQVGEIQWKELPYLEASCTLADPERTAVIWTCSFGGFLEPTSADPGYCLLGWRAFHGTTVHVTVAAFQRVEEAHGSSVRTAQDYDHELPHRESYEMAMKEYTELVEKSLPPDPKRDRELTLYHDRPVLSINLLDIPHEPTMWLWLVDRLNPEEVPDRAVTDEKRRVYAVAKYGTVKELTVERPDPHSPDYYKISFDYLRPENICPPYEDTVTVVMAVAAARGLWWWTNGWFVRDTKWGWRVIRRLHYHFNCAKAAFVQYTSYPDETLKWLHDGDLDALLAWTTETQGVGTSAVRPRRVEPARASRARKGGAVGRLGVPGPAVMRAAARTMQVLPAALTTVGRLGGMDVFPAVVCGHGVYYEPTARAMWAVVGRSENGQWGWLPVRWDPPLVGDREPELLLRPQGGLFTFAPAIWVDGTHDRIYLPVTAGGHHFIARFAGQVTARGQVTAQYHALRVAEGRRPTARIAGDAQRDILWAGSSLEGENFRIEVYEHASTLPDGSLPTRSLTPPWPVGRYYWQPAYDPLKDILYVRCQDPSGNWLVAAIHNASTANPQWRKIALLEPDDLAPVAIGTLPEADAIAIGFGGFNDEQTILAVWDKASQLADGDTIGINAGDHAALWSSNGLPNSELVAVVVVTGRPPWEG